MSFRVAQGDCNDRLIDDHEEEMAVLHESVFFFFCFWVLDCVSRDEEFVFTPILDTKNI